MLLYIRLVAILCCYVFPLGAQHTSFLVDFGSGGFMVPSPDLNGKRWNHVLDSNFTSGIGSLISDTGISSGISLSVTGFAGGANTNGTTVPDAAALGSLAVSNATSDSFYVANSDVLTVTFSNLPVTGRYRLSLFGSRDWPDTRTTRYDVKGSTQVTRYLTTSGNAIGQSPQQNANRSSLALFDDLIPGSDGSLVVEVRRHAGDFGYIGALRLEVLTPINFPPVAQSPTVNGSPRVGTTLVANFLYSDPENDALGSVEYVWEKANDASGSGAMVIQSLSSSATYTAKLEDQGFFYRCGIKLTAVSGQRNSAVTYSPWFGPIRPSSVLASFHVGNSFTLWTNIPKQLENLALGESRPSLARFQLTNGQTLNYHWISGHQAGYGITSGKRSRDELATGSWDALVLQPHSQEWMNSWSIGDFTDHARKFAQLADTNGTQVYLYAYWPWSSLSITEQTTINARFEQVRATISATLSKPVLVIPAGEALRAVISACGTGDLAAYNRSSFYIDERHQSALGGYVTALTHYATIYKKSPVGLPASTLSALADNQTVSIPPAAATRIQQIVWAVVQAYPYSGLGATSFSTVPIPPPIIIPPPAVIPPPLVEPDPPFVTESVLPSDPVLLSYAFGSGASGTPSVPENLPHPVPAAAGTFATEYTINPSAENEGVVYAPHWSYDLKNWTATQPTNTVISRTNNTVRIEWSISSRWRFLRIHVSRPAQ